MLKNLNEKPLFIVPKRWSHTYGMPVDKEEIIKWNYGGLLSKDIPDDGHLNWGP